MSLMHDMCAPEFIGIKPTSTTPADFKRDIWHHSPPMQIGETGVAFHPESGTQRLYRQHYLDDHRMVVIVTDKMHRELLYVLGAPKTYILMGPFLSETL